MLLLMNPYLSQREQYADDGWDSNIASVAIDQKVPVTNSDRGD
jgi:hypothetical protein